MLSVCCRDYTSSPLQEGLQEGEPVLQQVVLGHIVGFQIRVDTNILDYGGERIVSLAMRLLRTCNAKVTPAIPSEYGPA